MIDTLTDKKYSGTICQYPFETPLFEQYIYTILQNKINSGLLKTTLEIVNKV